MGRRGDGAMGTVLPVWTPVANRKLEPEAATADSALQLQEEEEESAVETAELVEDAPEVQSKQVEAVEETERTSTESLTLPASNREVEVSRPLTPVLQAKCDACEQEESLEEAAPDLQRKLGAIGPPADPNDDEEQQPDGQVMMRSEGSSQVATPNLEQSLRDSQGSGSPLSDETRTSMESAFHSDFRDVRVHTDHRAASMNQGLNAQAFTHGADVYFNQGKFSPNSKSGQQLLAHELTHVVQQGHAGSLKRKLDDAVPAVQREEEESSWASSAWNAVSSGASWVGEQVSSGVEAVGDAAGAVVNLGRSALATAV